MIKRVNEDKSHFQNECKVPAADGMGALHRRSRKRVADAVRATLLFLWVLPNTLIGLMVGVLGVLTGGGAGRTGRVLEFWGAFTGLFLRLFPPFRGSAAVTFGHVVLYCSGKLREKVRDHELVHVEQYERWGPMFIPLYLLSSLVAWIRGRHPYYENVFEKEAFLRCPTDRCRRIQTNSAG